MARALYERFISYFGVPTIIYTDRGNEFENQLMRQLGNLLGFRKLATCAYLPQANGLVERANSTFVDKLRALAKAQANWVTALPAVMHAYNTTVHESLAGATPAEAFFGWVPRTPTALATGETPTKTEITEDFCKDLYEGLQSLHAQLRKDYAKQSRKVQMQPTGYKNQTFAEGDVVWYYRPVKKPRHKLGTHWQGPYVVILQISEEMYMLQETPFEEPFVADVQFMKTFEGDNKPAWWKPQPIKLTEIPPEMLEEPSDNTDVAQI